MGSPKNAANDRERYSWFHACFGWGGLVVFITLGLVLEVLLGLKIDFYLNVDSEARRLVWRLAHAHGALICLLHIGFAATIATLPRLQLGKRLKAASLCLVSATILLPGGFFAGGFGTHLSDPGIGIYLSPPGGLLLLAAAVLVAWEVGRARP